MLIKALELQDFGQYRGSHRIDLAVDWGSGRNLVLVGGLNGSGKTTLMKAIRLALFGKLNEDLWRRRSYKSFIRSCLNRASARQGIREFCLSIQLDVGDVHGLSVLEIRRRWKLARDLKLTSESIQLFTNGQERLGFTQDEAELFILERVPYGLARFVFFDGDRIQDIARAELLGPHVKSAIESVLGLKLYLDLYRDLVAHERHFIRLHSGDTELGAIMQQVDRASRELEC